MIDPSPWCSLSTVVDQSASKLLVKPWRLGAWPVHIERSWLETIHWTSLICCLWAIEHHQSWLFFNVFWSVKHGTQILSNHCSNRCSIRNTSRRKLDSSRVWDNQVVFSHALGFDQSGSRHHTARAMHIPTSYQSWIVVIRKFDWSWYAVINHCQSYTSNFVPAARGVCCFYSWCFHTWIMTSCHIHSCPFELQSEW